MNKVMLCGRLINDPEVRYSQGEKATAIAKYCLAVQRKIKTGGQDADFINCTAIGKNGEFAEKYLKKGIKIIVAGRIQTGSYTNKDGQKVYTTEVMVDEHEFCESKGSSTASESVPSQSPVSTPISSDGFMSIPNGVGEALPFD